MTAGHACAQLRNPDEASSGSRSFLSKVIVAGGFGSSAESDRNPIASVEIFDPATDRWSSGPDLPEPRFGAVMVQYGLDEVRQQVCH